MKIKVPVSGIFRMDHLATFSETPQMYHPSRGQLIRALLPFVRQAGDAAMAQWRGVSQTMIKPDGSPVTAADLECNSILCGACARLAAHIPVLSEENCALPPSVEDQVFVIDPIDGTKEFIAGRKDFTINIALIEKGIPTGAVIYAPAHHRLFYCEGQGLAFEEDRKGHCRLLPSLVKSGEALRVVVSRSHLDERTRQLLSKLAPSSVQQVGSSLKFALIATGEADFYPRLSPTMIWDCAAGQALISAVGGIVLRPNGEHLRCDSGRGTMVDGFMASASEEFALVAANILRSMPMSPVSASRASSASD
jgi:3'(2'), 5'-bisphosphate nucleotidase